MLIENNLPFKRTPIPIAPILSQIIHPIIYQRIYYTEGLCDFLQAIFICLSNDENKINNDSGKVDGVQWMNSIIELER